MKKGIKLLTAWTLSALMTISTISVAFADDTASETVSADEVTLIGTIKDGVSETNDGLFGGPAENCFNDKKEITVPANGSEFSMVYFGNENSAANAKFKASDKYSISFDLKLNNDYQDNASSSIWIWGSKNTEISDESNTRIAGFDVKKTNGECSIVFWKNGANTQGGTTNYSINANEWVNLKAVIYPKKEKVDNNRIEWYANGKLIMVAQASSTIKSSDRAARKLYVTPAKQGLVFNNVKIETMVRNNNLNSEAVSEQLTTIGNHKAPDTAATGILGFDSSSSNYALENDGVKILKDTDLYRTDNTLESELESCDKYSVSFDVKTDATEADPNKLLTDVFLYDKNAAVNPNNSEQKTSACALGLFKLYTGKIGFSTNGGTGLALKEYSITPGKWVNVEYVVSPRKEVEGKTTDFAWYLNGRYLFSGTVADSWEKTKTGIYKWFNPATVNSNGSSGKFWFNNFSINAIDTVKRYDGLFTANASVNNDNKLEVVFSKSVADAAIAKNVVIKDSEDMVITPSSVSLSDDKKTLTIDIPGGATAEYYSVQLPERLTDTDSLVISNPTVYTPHLGLTNAQIIKNGASGNFSLKTAYDNTNNEDAEIFAVIVAYDKTTNALIRADFAKYTVPANGTYTPETLPTISAENSENTTVKAFIWRQTSLAPICDVIPYRAN